MEKKENSVIGFDKLPLEIKYYISEFFKISELNGCARIIKNEKNTNTSFFQDIWKAKLVNSSYSALDSAKFQNIINCYRKSSLELFFAILDKKDIQKFILKSSNLHVPNPSRLYLVAKSNNLDVVEYIFSCLDVNLLIRECSKQSAVLNPLFAAAENGNLEMFNYIKKYVRDFKDLCNDGIAPNKRLSPKKGDLNVFRVSKQALISKAIEGKNMEIIREILDLIDEKDLVIRRFQKEIEEINKSYNLTEEKYLSLKK